MTEPREEPARPAGPPAPGNPQHPAEPGALSREQGGYWDEKYGTAERLWSGKVNAALAAVVGALPDPAAGARSLDVGCGEGGDVLWLAERGWHARGVDLSAVAIGRARAEAERRGLAARFDAGHLLELRPGLGGPFDLVTTSFLHGGDESTRAETLRAAAGLVGPGGRLLIVSHAAPPSWAHSAGEDGAHAGPPGHVPIVPADDVAAAGLGAGWTIERSELRRRPSTSPEGVAGTIDDSVVLALREA